MTRPATLPATLPAADPTPRSRALDFGALWERAALACFAGLIALPLAFYFARFFASPAEPLGRIFGSAPVAARLLELMLRTGAIAALAATFAIALALALFIAIEPLGPRARAVCFLAASIPFFIPGHYLAIAWILAAGNSGRLTAALAPLGIGSMLPRVLYSEFGCALVMATRLYPIALALLAVGMRAAGRAPLESAATFMTPAGIWRGVIRAWLRPWIALAWLAAFILASLDYAIPSSLQIHVFTVEILAAWVVNQDAAQAMALAMPLLLMAGLAAIPLAGLLKRANWPSAGAAMTRMPPLPPTARRTANALALAIVLAAAALPLVTFALLSGGWTSWRPILIGAGRPLAVSIFWSLAAAIVAVLLGIGLASIGVPCGLRPAALRQRHSSKLTSRALPLAMILIFALPASMIAMAHIAFWNAAAAPSVFHAFYDSGLMLPLGMISLFTPLAFGLFRLRARETPRVLIELESLAAHPSTAWLGAVALPRLARPALFAAALVFVLAMQELHASILLNAPGQQTLAIRAAAMLHQETDAHVAAFCLLTIAAIAAGLGLLFAAARAAQHLASRWFPGVALR